jgi:hypothetical protein
LPVYRAFLRRFTQKAVLCTNKKGRKVLNFSPLGD